MKSKSKTQYGTLEDVFEGNRFRFIGSYDWLTVYSTHGCMCGDENCRPEREVIYYTGEWPGYEDKHGNEPSTCKIFSWDWHQEPPEVEWIACDPLSPNEKIRITDRRVAEYLAAQREKAGGKPANSNTNPNVQEKSV
jgi:hypothetical protein